jgi:hypothetical protein
MINSYRNRWHAIWLSMSLLFTYSPVRRRNEMRVCVYPSWGHFVYFSHQIDKVIDMKAC